MIPEPQDNIIVTCVYPPIPIRTCDWSAHRDWFDPDSRRGHVGWGETREAAIQNLLDQEEDAQ